MTFTLLRRSLIMVGWWALLSRLRPRARPTKSNTFSTYLTQHTHQRKDTDHFLVEKSASEEHYSKTVYDESTDVILMPEWKSEAFASFFAHLSAFSLISRFLGLFKSQKRAIHCNLQLQLISSCSWWSRCWSRAEGQLLTFETFFDPLLTRTSLCCAVGTCCCEIEQLSGRRMPARELITQMTLDPDHLQEWPFLDRTRSFMYVSEWLLWRWSLGYQLKVTKWSWPSTGTWV